MVIFDPRVEDGGDVGMVEAGRNLRFPPDCLDVLRLCGCGLVHDFDRYGPAQLRIFGPVDPSLPTGSYLF